MYNSSMFTRNIYRSPEAGDTSGSPSVSVTSSNGETAGAGAGAGSAQASAPEYISKSDFESFRNELTGHLAKLTPKQEAAARKEEAAPTASKRPNLKDYDFAKGGEAEVIRYEDDVEAWRESAREAKQAEKAQAKAAEERQQNNEKGHRARLAEYRKENPAYDTDLKAAGNIQVLTEVLGTIYSSKNSPAIVHYLAKNKDVAEELNTMAEVEGMDSVRERLGEIAATVKAEKQALAANAEAAAAKPPRQNFSKGSKGANHEPSLEERYTRFRS